MKSKLLAAGLSGVVSLWAGVVQAGNHALLIGVSEYQSSNITPLDGPVYDVQAMRKLLVSNWGFDRDNVKVLMNSQATKRNILDTLDRYARTGKQGDHLLIYFSGHGTSAANRKLEVPLAHSTGAFLPWDSRFDAECMRDPSRRAGCAQDVVNSAIVGSRDLKPRLQQLEQRFVITYVNDSCFSGNAVRSLSENQALASRAVNLDLVEDDEEDCGSDCGKAPHVPYPYQNVFSFAASGTHQPASDIGWKRLKAWPTLDGKPHGAFTDAFLRVLSGDLNADQNRDGQLTNYEVMDAVRRYMSDREYIHSPASLPPFYEAAAPYERVFLSSTSLPKVKQSTGDLASSLTISLGRYGHLKSALADTGFKQVSAPQQPAIRVVQGDSGLALIDRSGNTLASDIAESPRALGHYLRARRASAQWQDGLSAKDFSLKAFPAVLSSPNLSSTLAEGDQLYFTLKAEKTSQLMIFDLMADGTIAVLYPTRSVERDRRFAAGSLQTVFEAPRERLEISPPYGSDQVFVVAFSEWPEALDQLIPYNGTMPMFDAGSDKANHLYQILTNSGYEKSIEQFSLFTAEVR